MKKMFLVVIAAFSIAALISCGGGGSDGPYNLDGTWIVSLATGSQEKMYMQFDGAGTITEVGSFNSKTDPAGTYHVNSDNTFSATVYNATDPDSILTGTLTSPTQGTFSGSQETYPDFSGRLIKVSDPSACQGTWIGTLSETGSGPTYSIALAVDATGSISRGSIWNSSKWSHNITGRKLYCQSGNAVAFIQSAAPDSYRGLQLDGILSGSEITGDYKADGKSGSFALTLDLSGVPLPGPMPGEGEAPPPAPPAETP